jgi:hypothetical protein
VRCISGPRPVTFRLHIDHLDNVTFRLHIDHLDNAGGEVWALSFARRYLTVRRVQVVGVLETVFRGRRATQPRAFLTGIGSIWLSADKREARIR